MGALGYILTGLSIIVPSALCFVFGIWKRNVDNTCKEYQARDAAKNQLMVLLIDSHCAMLGLSKIMANGLLNAGLINGETEAALKNSQDATLALKKFLHEQGVRHVF